MINKRKGVLGSVIAGACVFGLLYPSAYAVAGGTKGWKVKTTVESTFKYDTNIFKLSSTQRDKLDANSASNVTSGRFKDMETTGDFIVSPALKVALKTRGLNGKTLVLKPGVVYNIYTQNTEKNYAKLGFDVEQSLGGRSSVGVKVDYAPSVYGKNYLFDAVDGNSDGNISTAEKVYKKSDHDNFSVAGTYGRRLWKGKKHGNGKLGALGVNSVDGELLVGYSKKEYDAPFSNRTETGFMAGGAVNMVVDKSVDLTFRYLFESIDTPVSAEVLIRNENNFSGGTDLNGNSTTTDTAARTVQNVDRSRTEHTFGFKAATKVGNGWNGYFKYDLRLQNYLSNETYDVTRVDRDDVRHRLGIGLDKKYGKNWSLGFDYRWTQEKAGRSALANTDKAETKSYTKHEVSAVLAYNF